MQTLSRKSDAKVTMDQCLHVYHTLGIDALLKEFEVQILNRKVKFPILEYCAKVIYEELPANRHLEFCDAVEALKTIGGNVILGIVLQSRLDRNFEESIEKATEYISRADAWYVCDIIGERVFGYSLVQQPVKTIPRIKKLSKHESYWVVRSLGAGIHYSIKKGLPKNKVKQLFPLLLSMANTKNKEIRQGVGWAAKTTAKFHPDLIAEFDDGIQDQEAVANWFRRKVEIGLNRNRYAQRN